MFPKSEETAAEVKETKKERKELLSDSVTIATLESRDIESAVENSQQIQQEDIQFQAVLDSNGIPENPVDLTTIENEIIFENIKPMEVFRGLEGNQDQMENVRSINKNLQKQKLANENSFFR